MFRSLRGPSNSQKNIFCQVDNPNFPLTMGIISEGPPIPFACNIIYDNLLKN
jgi:hypothetical protein